MVHAHTKGQMKMGKQIFRLQLDDQALPGFASGAKDYFGTLEMIEGFINAILYITILPCMAEYVKERTSLV